MIIRNLGENIRCETSQPWGGVRVSEEIAKRSQVIPCFSLKRSNTASVISIGTPQLSTVTRIGKGED